jgi:methionine aminotransferase
MIGTYSKLPGTSNSIFSVMSQLAAKHNAINLSQGFPDYDCDPALVEFVAQAMRNGHNQYAPMPGLASLRNLVADKVNLAHGSAYHPDTDVTITAGGTEAIFTALTACIQPGDEVIIFEPAYDAYAPTIRMLGGLVKSYEMAPPDYSIDWDMVTKLFSSSTKMIILNSPHNPTGSVLTEEDIQSLIKLTRGTDVMILSDEVYEHLVYDGEVHRSLARYEELRERTFIVASFGKLLHTTGWKIGYCLAPESLMKEFRKIHQFNVFSVNTPMQAGIANYLQNPQSYMGLTEFFLEKRNLFRSLLEQTRFKLLPCKGSYFQCVRYGHLFEEEDTVVASRLITENGVASIPVSAFYIRNTDHQVLRFCFAKKQETLEKAVERLIKI